ncbi:nucleolar protein nop-58 [Gaeumannomyces tritici R3-111a-1]|uniref:Nucleolar protein 58 n=1 Tax=Gaeumannomyces tritici (strain R3-111a-1) TaxID=644352 RepID=J3PB83_GAET3|nr:nucleolar protein nop-58 [Gaeumannomyces tritici R3-111a-1]EJT71499.1 nucleolar protein nop-58 [Gaeumannomyces tritici R3-111a-1]
MPLFILAETSAGYGLFKAKDKKLLDGDVESRLDTAEMINNELKLKEFVKWESASAAVGEIGALLEGKVPPMLAGLMDAIKDEKKVSLAVADKNIGVALQRLPGFANITTLASGSATTDLYRGIRTHLSELIPGILPENFKTMSLGLSHSLSRHKLRFSADKVDVMIIQAISLLDDLDKELNTYAMRVKEWYGWHFPELGKILNDNMAYAKVIQKMGLRSNAPKADLSEVLPEEIENAVKAAADLSMGTEISEEDLENITLLADQVVSYSEYRTQLSAYLEARMRAIAPSLTELVGYLVGARLIAHAGSLMNLAKNPGSTIQILGAEKALFRALKTKHATPKYGLIYHASLVGQATGKNKGKIARQLAAKAALGVRADALTEYKDGEEADEEARAVFGAAQRAKIENNLRRLEGKPILAKGIAVGPNGNAAPAPTKWDVKEARKYNADADGLAGNELAEAETPAKESKKDKKKEKKEKKKPKKEATPEDDGMENGADEEVDDAPAKAADATSSKPGKASSPSEADFERLAEQAGISVSKFKRKYERGEVELDASGAPVVHSKKELKKMRKSLDAVSINGGEKRKRDDDEEKPKKKKKKQTSS